MGGGWKEAVEMLEFDKCPHCGKKIIKGAMKCPGCGKILKTPEEQIASIQKIKEAKKKFNVAGLIETIVVLLALGVLFYYFSEPIISFVRKILNK